MNESTEDVMDFVGNVLRAVLIDLKLHGAPQSRLENIANMIEDENVSIFDPEIQAKANLVTIMALAGALTSSEHTNPTPS